MGLVRRGELKGGIEFTAHEQDWLDWGCSCLLGWCSLWALGPMRARSGMARRCLELMASRHGDHSGTI